MGIFNTQTLDSGTESQCVAFGNSKQQYYLLSLFLDCTGSEVCIALDDPVNNTKEVSKCLAKYC